MKKPHQSRSEDGASIVKVVKKLVRDFKNAENLFCV